MCGIAGVFQLGGCPSPAGIFKATECLRHRGPDDEGYLAFDSTRGVATPLSGKDSQVPSARLFDYRGEGDLFLGHRRLSILDLSPLGHQPMANRSGATWIVYNGEIYNYLDLRRELQGRGHVFRTRTDTEVLLAAYDEWGEDCLDRLDGMWAFVILDSRRRVLFGSRDRFGVKPLYYYHDPGHFAFASEIKALMTLPFIGRSVNRQAAFDFLALGWVENKEEGLFRGVFELLPSHSFRLELASNALKKEKYYRLPCNCDWEAYDPRRAGELADLTREHLQRAVASHLQSDVPLGSCLSGGLDSSTVVCLVNQMLEKDHPSQLGDRQRVFTSCFGDGRREDEQKWARYVVEQTRTSWHKSFVEPSHIEDAIEDIAYTQDVPFPSSGGVLPQYFLMKVVRDNGVKVLLDGQGGDELFAGYKGFYLSALADNLRNGAWGALIREISRLNGSAVDVGYVLRSWSKTILPRLMPRFAQKTALRSSRREIRYLQPEFWREYRDQFRFYSERRVLGLNLALHATITDHPFKYLLRYEDRNSMRSSIEARTPMADHRALIEFAFSLPGSYKIRDGWTKRIMRDATAGILPEPVRWRRDKLGFPAPESYWLRRLSGLVQDYFDGETGEFLDRRLLRRDLPHLIHNPSLEQYNPFVWRVFIFIIWRKAFGV
jgi:asparagine synthase (glutamine-hydrolysing)